MFLLLQKWMSAPDLTTVAVSSAVSTRSVVTSVPVTLGTNWRQTNGVAKVSMWTVQCWMWAKAIFIGQSQFFMFYLYFKLCIALHFRHSVHNLGIMSRQKMTSTFSIFIWICLTVYKQITLSLCVVTKARFLKIIGQVHKNLLKRS